MFFDGAHLQTVQRLEYVPTVGITTEVYELGRRQVTSSSVWVDKDCLLATSSNGYPEIVFPEPLDLPASYTGILLTLLKIVSVDRLKNNHVSRVIQVVSIKPSYFHGDHVAFVRIEAG